MVNSSQSKLKFLLPIHTNGDGTKKNVCSKRSVLACFTLIAALTCSTRYSSGSIISPETTCPKAPPSSSANSLHRSCNIVKTTWLHLHVKFHVKNITIESNWRSNWHRYRSCALFSRQIFNSHRLTQSLLPSLHSSPFTFYCHDG